MVIQLYPQALGSLFIASYDLQGYGGGMRPRHLGMDCIENIVSTNSSIVTSRFRCSGNVFIEPLPRNEPRVITWLSICCLATAVSFSHRVTLFNEAKLQLFQTNVVEEQ
jgi:hypothetical protein